MRARKPPRTIYSLLAAMPLERRVAFLRRELQKATGKRVTLRDLAKHNATIRDWKRKHRAAKLAAEGTVTP